MQLVHAREGARYCGRAMIDHKKLCRKHEIMYSAGNQKAMTRGGRKDLKRCCPTNEFIEMSISLIFCQSSACRASVSLWCLVRSNHTISRAVTDCKVSRYATYSQEPTENPQIAHIICVQDPNPHDSKAKATEVPGRAETRFKSAGTGLCASGFAPVRQQIYSSTRTTMCYRQAFAGILDRPWP